MIPWSTISLRDLAGYISEELRKKGIDTILVGGACVTIYSENKYQSYDLDYITYNDMRKVRKALAEIGWIEENRYFKHTNCPWIIEFVSPPIAVGNEAIYDFNVVKTELGSIKLLHAIDSIKDRLSQFYHWNDRQALEQALAIYEKYPVDLEEIKNWSVREQQLHKFEIFLKKVKN